MLSTARLAIFAVTLLVSFWVLFRMLFGRDDGGNA